jgi:hypothetical protein
VELLLKFQGYIILGCDKECKATQLHCTTTLRSHACTLHTHVHGHTALDTGRCDKIHPPQTLTILPKMQSAGIKTSTVHLDFVSQPTPALCALVAGVTIEWYIDIAVSVRQQKNSLGIRKLRLHSTRVHTEAPRELALHCNRESCPHCYSRSTGQEQQHRLLLMVDGHIILPKVTEQEPVR